MMLWSTFNTCLLDIVLPIYEVNDNNYNNSNSNDSDNNDDKNNNNKNINIYNNNKRNSAVDIS